MKRKNWIESTCSASDIRLRYGLTTATQIHLSSSSILCLFLKCWCNYRFQYWYQSCLCGSHLFIFSYSDVSLERSKLNLKYKNNNHSRQSTLVWISMRTRYRRAQSSYYSSVPATETTEQSSFGSFVEWINWKLRRVYTIKRGKPIKLNTILFCQDPFLIVAEP